jgi:YfiH family protein
MSACITADWPAPANINAFTTTRQGPGFSALPFYKFNLGSRCGDDATLVLQNRAALVNNYQLPSEPQWLHQVHGVDVVRFDVQSRGAACCAQQSDEPLSDASVTDTPNVVLAVLTADCLPVLFCNVEGTEIAAAHAGWRGLANGMLETTVSAMHSKPEDIMAWLGPAAGALRYEIGEEVRTAFLSLSAEAETAFMATRKGHYLIDMVAIAKQRLQAVGVKQIYGGEYCTISDIRFYSHRREQRTGRMASVIWMG